jgi:hypothetical protein
LLDRPTVDAISDMVNWLEGSRTNNTPRNFHRGARLIGKLIEAAVTLAMQGAVAV